MADLVESLRQLKDLHERYADVVEKAIEAGGNNPWPTDARKRLSTAQQTHYVYRMYDDQEDLLYIGVTCNPARRFNDHRDSKNWFNDIATVQLETYPNQKAAYDAEAYAIKHERPLHNRVLPEAPRTSPKFIERKWGTPEALPQFDEVAA